MCFETEVAWELAMYVDSSQVCASASLVLGLKVCATTPAPLVVMALRELLHDLEHFRILMTVFSVEFV